MRPMPPSPLGLAMGPRPIFGVAKSWTSAGHVSDICPTFVPARNTMMCLQFGLKLSHGQKVDRLWISPSQEIVQVLSTCRVSRL